MTDSISPTVLSDLVGSIYDCALDPRRWPATLDAIRGELRFATAALSLTSLTDGRLLLDVAAGIKSPWRERMADYGGEIMELWGGAEVARSFPLGEPAVLSRVNPSAMQEWTNPYIVEWGQPQGLIDTMAIVLARDGTSVGALGLGRHQDQGPIGEREVAWARLLTPHLQRAGTISRLLDIGAVGAGFEAVLDGLAMPVILVGKDRTVLHRNEASKALLGQGSVLTSYENRLYSPHPAVALRLAEAILQCGEDEGALTQLAFGIPVRSDDGQVFAIHVLPLMRRAVRRGLFTTAVAAVFVSTPRTTPGAAAEAVASLFSLTSAETRMFELIASGSTPAQAATALGIAASTAKSHLLKVFEKVGVHRQADLVQLAASLVSPLEPPRPTATV